MAKKRKRKMHYKHPKHYIHKNGLSKHQPKAVLGPHPFAVDDGVDITSQKIRDVAPPTMPSGTKDHWAHRSATMRCRTCMWFSPKNGVVGRCRRRSPSPDGSVGWPVVFIIDWCGDHKIDETRF